MKGRKIKAIALEEPIEEIEKRTTLSIRPTKNCFLIPENTDLNTIAKLVSYCTAIWGGSYSLWIPGPQKTRYNLEDWKRFIWNFDPEQFVSVNSTNIPQETYKSFIQESSLINRLVHFPENWEEDHYCSGHDAIDNLPMQAVLPREDIFQDLRQIKIINPPKDSPLFMSTILKYGNPDPRLKALLKNYLQADEIPFGPADLNTYCKAMVNRGSLYPLDLTIYGLEKDLDLRKSVGVIGPAIFILGENLITDICLYWNLKDNFRYRGIHSLLISSELLDDPKNYHDLKDWLEKFAGATNCFNILSASLTPEQLQEIRGRINPILPSGERMLCTIMYDWFSDYFSPIKMYAGKSHQLSLFRNGEAVLHCSSLYQYMKSIQNNPNTAMVDISIMGYRRRSQGILLPRIREIDKTIWSQYIDLFPNKRRERITSSGFTFSLPGVENPFFHLRLLREKDIFGNLFGSKGYTLNYSEKARYTAGFVRLFGGLNHTKLLQKTYMRMLLRQMSDRKSRIINEMIGIVSPGKNGDPIRKEIEHLIEKEVLMRGYEIACCYCNLRTWYPVEKMQNKMTCMGCMREFLPPCDTTFSYRLNELIVVGIEQGCIPVILSLQLLRSLSNESFFNIPGNELKKDEEVIDLDIVSLCDGELVFLECKDFEEAEGFPQEKTKEYQDLKSEIGKLIQLAEKLKGVRLVIASFSTELRDVVSNMYPDKVSRINFWDGKDLERGKLVNQDSSYFHLSQIKRFDNSDKDYQKRGKIIEPGIKWDELL